MYDVGVYPARPRLYPRTVKVLLELAKEEIEYLPVAPRSTSVLKPLVSVIPVIWGMTSTVPALPILTVVLLGVEARSSAFTFSVTFFFATVAIRELSHS